MKTPIDNLRDGLNQRDWNLVSEGFHGLTGEKIEVFREHGNPARLLRYLIDKTEEAIEVVENELVFNSNADASDARNPPKKKRTTKKKVVKKRAVKKKELEDSAGEDEGGDSEDQDSEDEEIEETEELEEVDPWAKFRTKTPEEKRYEKAIARENTWQGEVEEDDSSLNLNKLMCGNLKPAARTRKKVRMINRTCERCGREYTVHPEFRARRYEKDAEPTAFVCDTCLPSPDRESRRD